MLLQTSNANPINQKAMDFIAKGPKLLLIGGQWIPAVSGKTFETINPATEEVLTTVSEAETADIDLAVAAARKAFEDPSWAGITPHARERFLQLIADLIEANAEELAIIESLDNGVPLPLARQMVGIAIRTFRYYSGWPTKVFGKTNPSDSGAFVYTLKEPLGVCAAIIPWNVPIFMASWKIAPAIAFGNTVVIKPSELTPLSILRLGELLIEAGLPAGVVNIVPGFGATAGSALVSHPGIDKITFTGSTAVGKNILKSSVDSLTKVTLELGGKSPNIIFPDADMDRAITAAVRGFSAGSGQICVATTRVFIQEDVYEEVAAKIVAIAKKIKVGSGLDPETQMGPINNQKQFDKIKSYFEIAKEEGATLATGGNVIAGKGFFLEPTVYTHIKNDTRLAQEEIFGPVVTLIAFKDENDVVLQANHTVYGLTAAVWTKDLNRAHRVARALKAGTIWVNTINELDPINPFGGYKQSGIGREHGQEAVDTYTQVKSVIIRY